MYNHPTLRRHEEFYKAYQMIIKYPMHEMVKSYFLIHYIVLYVLLLHNLMDSKGEQAEKGVGLYSTPVSVAGGRLA